MTIIKSIEIENFQSHVLTRLELDQGLNVIVGPSDQGKSAIIRALRWVFYNEPRGTDFFRVGSNSCRVKVELESGEQITRERTSSKNRYIYRDQSGVEKVFEGFGNTVPLEITTVLQMPRVALDTDTEITLNIGYQLEGPFLLNESGTLRAKMVGRLTGVHIMDAAIRDVAKDLLNQQQEEKRLDEDLKEINKGLERYSYLPSLLNSIKQEEVIVSKIEFLQSQMVLLRELKGKWDEVRREENRVKEILAFLPPLERVENLLNQAAILNLRYSHLEKLTEQWGRIEIELDKVESFVERTQDIKEIETGLIQTEKNIKRLEVLLQLQGKIKNWKKEYQQTKEVWTRLVSVSQGEKIVQSLNSKVEQLKRLKESQSAIVTIKKEILTQNRELEKLKAKLSTTLKEYQIKLKTSGKCPLCFCDIDEEVMQKVINNYQLEGGS